MHSRTHLGRRRGGRQAGRLLRRCRVRRCVWKSSDGGTPWNPTRRDPLPLRYVALIGRLTCDGPLWTGDQSVQQYDVGIPFGNCGQN